MIRIPMLYVKPGMVTARSIYSASGNLLLAEDFTLNKLQINRLDSLGVTAVYIKNPHFEGAEPPEILQEQTKVQTVSLTRTAFENFRTTKTINLAGFSRVARSIVDEVIENRNVLIHLTDIRTHDDYTFSHSLNVCLLSVMTGIKLGYGDRQLRELALGALLHDLGKMLIPPEILTKPGKLSPPEWEIMQQHVNIGFEVLRDKQEDVPLLSSHVAFQHHENYDGTGYTRRLGGKEIHEYARIAAVADIYDALTADRTYRPALLPHEAYEIVMASRGTRLDPVITDVFLENIAVYPIGSIVELNSGEIGVVIEVLPKLQTRPIVKIIAEDPGGRILAQERITDLTKELTKFVNRVLQPEEILALGQRQLA